MFCLHIIYINAAARGGRADTGNILFWGGLSLTRKHQPNNFGLMNRQLMIIIINGGTFLLLQFWLKSPLKKTVRYRAFGEV